MTIYDKIKDEKIQYDLNNKTAKTSVILSGKIDQHEYLTGKEILIFQAKLSAFWKLSPKYNN